MMKLSFKVPVGVPILVIEGDLRDLKALETELYQLWKEFDGSLEEYPILEALYDALPTGERP